MFTGALLIPIAMQCAISALSEAPPDPARPPELEYWLTCLEAQPRFAPIEFEGPLGLPAQPDDLAALREQIARAMQATASAPAPTSRGGFPMRIYGCDAAGPTCEFIASPALAVIHAETRDR